MYKTSFLHPAAVALTLGLLSCCQTTYSALPDSGGYSFSAMSGSSRPVPDEPGVLMASATNQLAVPVAPHRMQGQASSIEVRKATSLYKPNQLTTGLQTQAPDTLLQAKPAEAPRKFGVTQGAHVVGGAMLLAGGITVISGFNSDKPGDTPLAIVLMGIILAVVGGAMLLFKGKNARRRR